MNPPSNQADEGSSAAQAMILGEMRGQLREVVHGLNNLSGKFDGLSREVIGLGALAKDVIELKTAHVQDINALKQEIADLKKERDQRTGAANLVNWLFKNWPGVVGFLLLIGILLRTQGKL